MAGLLIKALIVEGSSPWQEVYEPARKTPAGVLNFVSENVTAIKNLAQSLMPADQKSADDIKPGEGAIIARGQTKIAAYRDDNGRLHQRSARCTHLGCEVAWNSTERCWDCPCHGSQFSAEGAVLNGPAVSDLEPVEKAGAEKSKEKAAG
jgi:Rieske Fe-S protein